MKVGQNPPLTPNYLACGGHEVLLLEMTLLVYLLNQIWPLRSETRWCMLNWWRWWKFI